MRPNDISASLTETNRALRKTERLLRAARFTDPAAKHIRYAIPIQVYGGTAYLLTSPRCGTCRHPYRAAAEDAVMEGQSFRIAAERASEAAGANGTRLTERQVRYHLRRGHHPGPLAALLMLKRMAAEDLASRLHRKSVLS